MGERSKTALAAAKWWGDRLQQGDREKFEAHLAEAIDASLKEQEEKYPKYEPRVRLSCDYDPQGLVLDAVRAAGVECRGFMFSAEGILPQKHTLHVTKGKLEPKEGYGNCTAHILVEEP